MSNVLQQRWIDVVPDSQRRRLGLGVYGRWLQSASVDALDNKIIIPFRALCGTILARRARDIPAPARETD
jgi:hypothetical protein